MTRIHDALTRTGHLTAAPVNRLTAIDLFLNPGRVPQGGVREADPNPEPPKSDQPTPDQPTPGRGKDGRDKPPPYAPKLVCRTHLGDIGTRPLAPGLMFWESPDIWVTAPDGTDIPVAGKPNTVHVHVWNVGAAPSYGAVVELYWCNPSVGVNLAGATMIGVQGLTLQAGEHRILDFPWTPTIVNGGHECLVAHAYDPIADNLVAPFNPVLDCHVGQRNVNVISVPAGKAFDLHFLAANLSAQVARSQLHVQEIVGADLQGVAQLLGRGALAPARGAQAALTAAEYSEASTTLNLDEHPVTATFRETLDAAPSCYRAGHLRGALMTLAAQTTPQESPNQEPAHRPAPQQPAPLRAEQPNPAQLTQRRNLGLGRLTLKPRTQAALTLTVQPGAQDLPGSTFAYRVVETVDGAVTGGMTYVVRVSKD